MKKIPKSLADIGKLITSNIVTKIIGIGVLAFYARVLPKEGLAVFPIYFMLSDLASLVFSFGILPNLIKQLPSLLKNDKKTAQKLIKTSSIIIFFGTFLASFLVFIFYNEINNLILGNKLEPEIIRIMAIGFIALSLSKISEQLLWAAGRFGKKSMLSVLESFVRPFCTIPLFLTLGIKGIVVGLVLNQCIRAALATYYAWDLRPDLSAGVYPVKLLLKQSLPFYLESFVMYFRREGDNWLISTMLGPSILAVYYIAKTVYNSFYMLYTSVDQVVTAHIATYKNNKKVLLKKIRHIHNGISLISISGLLFAISSLPVAVPLVAGSKYNVAVWPAFFLLTALLINCQRIVISRTIFVSLKSIVRFKVTLFEVLTLLPGLFLLGSWYGASGIAAARLVAQLMAGIFEWWILSKKLTFSLNYKYTLMILGLTLPATIFSLKLQNIFQIINLNLKAQTVIIPLWLAITAVMVYITIGLTRKSFSELLLIRQAIKIWQD